MLLTGKNAVFGVALMTAVGALAQERAQTAGALVVIPATGNVRQANDEATLTFMLEEQDRDKAAAASRVNLKMKQGMDILKHEDPHAVLKSGSYSSYPVYPQDQATQPAKVRQPSAWRVVQYLEMRTRNLGHLPQTVAAAQRLLALDGLRFGLSDEASKSLDRKRIDAAYANLNERIAFVAGAMGRKASDAVLDSVDLEATGVDEPGMPKAMFAAVAAAAPGQTSVAEPNFEPGETELPMRLVAKVRFK